TEAVGKIEEPDLLETQMAELRVGGTYIGTILEWAAATVEDDFAVRRDLGDRLSQRLQPLGGSGRAGVNGTGNMPIGIKVDNTGLQNSWFRLRRQNVCEVFGLDEFLCGPRIARTPLRYSGRDRRGGYAETVRLKKGD